MDWLRRWMAGRYGADNLSLALLAVAVFLSVIFMFIPVPYLSLIPTLLVFYDLFRMMSRNIYARQKENEWFMRWSAPIRRWASGCFRRFRDRKIHRYFRCPSCHARLRVPKGRGKIAITCPKCKTEFIRKA